MDTITRSGSNETEIKKVNRLLAEIIYILKEDTKAAEDKVKRMIQSFAEGGNDFEDY